MLKVKVAVLGLCLGTACKLAAAEPVKDSSVQMHVDRVTNCLLPPVLVQGEARDCKTLAVRMAELHIPAVSIAMIHDGAVVWARAYGVQGPDGTKTTETTLFQAGSISKPLSAMAALRLVQSGKLALDADINQALTSWHLPSSPLAPDSKVTLRELLTHTGGLSVHGFPGYATGTPMPSLTQVLDGSKPANTGPIRIEAVPGKEWSYSGGGFIVMQQALIDVTHEQFPQLLKSTVLNPIGMLHSTYDQPLPAALTGQAALPYNERAQPLGDGAHIYPEMAAAGLWTTPSDLAKYMLEVQNSLAGKANHVLNTSMTKAMLNPGQNRWGLGVETGGSDANPYFTHGGVNEGFQSSFVAYEKAGGDGVAVMTNAYGGMRIVEEVIRSVATEYQWPDFQPSLRPLAKVSSAELQRYVGTYKATPTVEVVYTVEGDQLFAQATGQNKYPIYPEGQSKFFMKVVNAEIDFHTQEKGVVDYLVLRQGGQEYKELKK